MNIGDLFDSPWKVLIVAVVLIILFGSKKMPDAARSLGRSMRILKAEVSGLHPDEEQEQVKQAQFEQPQGQPQPLPAVSQQAQIDALQQQIRDLQQQQQAQPVGEAAGVNGTQATEAPRTQQVG
jgi:sec-independent protein translocase protein TatA